MSRSGSLSRSRSPLRLAPAAALALLALAAPAAAQQPCAYAAERPAFSTAFAKGDRLEYDLGLSMEWTVIRDDDASHDPLRLGSRLTLVVQEDARATGAAGGSALVLVGWIDFASAAYRGPGDHWWLEAGPDLRRDLRAIQDRLAPASEYDRYADRLARLEAELGLAAAGSECAFTARVGVDGEVSIEPYRAGMRLAPHVSAEAGEAFRAYLAQAVRFVLPRLSRPAPDRVQCDGLAMRTGRAERPVAPPGGGRATIGVGGAKDGLPPGLPFTLEAVLGARYGAAASSTRPGPLDVRTADEGEYHLGARGRVVASERSGFVLSRTLEVEEDVSGSSAGGSRLRVQANLGWKATLRAAKLGAPAREAEKPGRVEP